MTRRAGISLILAIVTGAIAVAAFVAWSREGGALANAIFQLAASVAVCALFFGVLTPPIFRRVLAIAGTTEVARRSPVLRFMADLDPPGR